MNKHTAGLWFFEYHKKYKMWNIFQKGAMPLSAVASVYSESSTNLDQIKSNARLIAAAPELLEALSQIIALDRTEENEWDAVDRVIPSIVEIAQAAIAKALGDQA